MEYIDENNETSIIKVIGVGGGGSNAVNHMHNLGIKGVEFIICNTDSQALDKSTVPHKIKLGETLTEGRGAGNIPEKGKESAIENLEDIKEMLACNTKMAFVTAGMGGGTGTGAAPVIAKTAKEMGILTVGIVTIPFRFEGQRRLNQAIEGIKEINEHVDSLLVISNEKLREIHGNLTISEAFAQADNILTTAAKGIAEIITVHGYVNVDFADVETVMANSGVAIMGSASAKGENRAIEAIREALTSPLLNNNNINGATNILLNITSGKEEVTMSEIGQINDFVQECAGLSANIIWGNGNDDTLNEELTVTVIATGFDADIIPELYIRKQKKARLYNLGDKTSEKEIIQQEISFDSSQSASLIGNKGNENSQQDNNPNYGERPAANYQYSRSDIEELESVPAFKRKGIQIDNKEYSGNPEISRYSLSDDDTGVSLKKILTCTIK